MTIARYALYVVRARIVAGAFVVALCLVSSAAAKQTWVTLVRPAETAKAGVAWAPRLLVRLNGKPFPKRGYRPIVYLRDATGTQLAYRFIGAATAPGQYRVPIVFPHPGRWSIVIPDPIQGDWTFSPINVTS